MKLVTQYPHACFAWTDLSTTDADAAKTFYTQLFGWEAVDMPLPMGGFYTMLQIDGHDVCALSQQQEEGMPPVWVSYINVDDVDTAAQKATAAGGNVFIPPMDVMEAGRMALLQDPTGAAVALWQAKDHIGSQVVNQPNSVVWNELATREPEKAATFYRSILGWDHRYDEANSYYVFTNQGRMAAGMITMNEQWEGIPPHWMVYFAVDDAQAMADKAASLGGTVAVPPQEIPGTGTFAVIQDPQGAVFSIIKMEQVDPPPGH